MENSTTSIPEYTDYEDYHTTNYDPQYTAEISNKMQVPDKIAVEQEGPRYSNGGLSDIMTARNGMVVPERIVMAGEDRHIGMRKNLQLLDFGYPIQENHHVGLTTPPRVLSMGEVTFPSVERDEQEDNRMSHNADPAIRNNSSPLPAYTLPASHGVQPGAGDMATLNDHYEELLTCISVRPELEPPTAGLGESLIVSDEDEMAVLRRQVAKLSRRLMRVEQENQTRSQRELVFYPIVVSYILFQVAAWFLRSNK